MLEEKSNKNINITVEIEPLNRNYLPPNLSMMILDLESQKVMEAISTAKNKNIKFKFKGETKDCFSLKITEKKFTFQEHFRL